MNLAISLRSELMKSKRTSSFYLCLLAASIVPVLYFFDTFTDGGSLERLKGDPWNHYLRPCWQGMTFLILPMFTILVNTLVPQVEFRNNTWKQALASPQPLWQLFLSKFLLIQGLILLCLLLFDVLILGSLYIVAVFRPEAGFAQHSLDWGTFLLSNGKAYGSLLALSAVQYWMGIRFRNFILPVGLGFSLWFIGGLVGLELQSPYIEYYPHAFSILIVYPKFEHLVDVLLWRSLILCLVILGLAYWDLHSRKRKV